MSWAQSLKVYFMIEVYSILCHFFVAFRQNIVGVLLQSAVQKTNSLGFT